MRRCSTCVLECMVETLALRLSGPPLRRKILGGIWGGSSFSGVLHERFRGLCMSACLLFESRVTHAHLDIKMVPRKAL
jgi:hypothetical protein